MTIAATLTQDVPRETRRIETTRLFTEAVSTGTEGDERAALIEQIIVLNTGVARSIARRYANRGIPLEDLEQVAYLALIRAARKFDGAKAEDFLTYAVPTIRGEIKRHFRDLGWMVRPTRRVQELQTSVLQTRETMRGASGRMPSAAEVAESLGVEEADVVEALSAEGCFKPLSLDAQIGTADGGDSASLGDMLPELGDDLPAAEARAVLAPALAALTDRERLIVRLRFVEDRTQGEIGKEIGVTQMQVSRLLSAIMRRLREAITETGIDGSHSEATAAA